MGKMFYIEFHYRSLNDRNWYTLLLQIKYGCKYGLEFKENLFYLNFLFMVFLFLWCLKINNSSQNVGAKRKNLLRRISLWVTEVQKSADTQFSNEVSMAIFAIKASIY